MTEYGIWSEAAGGFIETGFLTQESATANIASWVEEGEDAADLSIEAICDLHEEQPYFGCPICEDDD